MCSKYGKFHFFPEKAWELWIVHNPFILGHQVVKSHHRKTNPTKIDHTYPINIPNKLKIVKEGQLGNLLNAINSEQNLWN
jgi:hypothetical protein